MSIPRLLHFTWKSTSLPKQMQDYFDQWQRLHPGWDIRLWTDATMREFVAEAYPAFLGVYDGYPKMIQRADAFRYLVLGRLGGIYADLDVEPLQSVEPLLEHDCFVGIEPLEHIIADRIHQGVPFLFTNAFMGSVPGHRLWRDIVDRLPDLADQETFYSTGPSMVTAMALRLPKAERPVLLLPEVWSPLLANGIRTKSDARVKAMMGDWSRVVAADKGTMVSHKWLTTWVPWHKRNNRITGLLQIPTQAKWWSRRLRHRALAAVVIADPIYPYVEQALAPVAERPRIHIAVRLGEQALSEALDGALKGLDYPAEQLSIAVHALGEASAAERDNAILRSAPAEADYVLLVDGAVSAIPADALTQMLAARRPVVAANCVDRAGEPADAALFRYKDGGGFKVLYKDGGVVGPVQRNRAYRTTLGEQKVFAVLPLDGVGESCVLIHRDVIAAGVRFAEQPYKLHLGSEGFGIMARDGGFEVAGLPGVTVIRG